MGTVYFMNVPAVAVVFDSDVSEAIVGVAPALVVTEPIVELPDVCTLMVMLSGPASKYEATSTLVNVPETGTGMATSGVLEVVA